MQMVNKIKKTNKLQFLYLKSNYFFFENICHFKQKNQFIFFENDIIVVSFFSYIKYFSRVQQVYNNVLKNYYFIFANKFIKNVCSVINKYLRYNFPFYMFRVRVIGLNLKLLLKKKYKQYLLNFKNQKVKLKQFHYIRVDLGFSHYLDLKVPSSIFIRKRKRSWLFFGSNPGLLKEFLLTLTDIKAVTAYKLRGYPITGYPHVFKEGKKSFR